MNEIRRVMVLGSGTMGAGIAEVCAKAGMSVALHDLTRDLTDQGMERIRASLAKAEERGKLAAGGASAVLARIDLVVDYSTLPAADLVIEACPEDLPLKKQIFAEISKKNGSAVLASNTSSLSLTEIASASFRPERVIGLHFFNPPPVMQLLEIVLAEQTSKATVEICEAFAVQVEKTSIRVRDFPGFATSRLGVALGLEAIRMVESGVASVADIDRAMELGYRHPMGPLKLTDLVGLDVRLSIAEHLVKELGPQFAPPPLLRRLVRAGKLGKKAGEGFYVWEGNEPKEKRP